MRKKHSRKEYRREGDDNEVRVSVTLRLTVSYSLYLGVGHPFGTHDQILRFSFLLPENCFALRLGAPSLTRGQVCNL
jgi:hypothetical protein